MAFLKSKSDPNAAFALTSDVREASTALGSALDARNRIDAAVAKNAIDRQAFSEARTRAEAEAGSLALELALEIDEAKTIELKAKLAAARTTSQEATAAFDEADRLKGALYARAAQDDAQIAGARQAFHAALGTYGRATTEALAAEVQAAAQHLVAVLKRRHAMAFAIGNLSQSGGFLGDILIPSPAPGQPAIIGNGRADAADGSRIDLAADWRTDAGAAALADLMEPLSDLRRRAARHTPFTPPPAPAKLTEVNQQNRSAAEYNNAIEAREAIRDAAAPKPKSWSGQARTFETNAHYSR